VTTVNGGLVFYVSHFAVLAACPLRLLAWADSRRQGHNLQDWRCKRDREATPELDLDSEQLAHSPVIDCCWRAVVNFT
jgi:hypothetical protein